MTRSEQDSAVENILMGVESNISGTTYLCRDVSEVDHHLSEVLRRLAHFQFQPDLVSKLRGDLDRLLARREYLVVVEHSFNDTTEGRCD